MQEGFDGASVQNIMNVIGTASNGVCLSLQSVFLSLFMRPGSPGSGRNFFAREIRVIPSLLLLFFTHSICDLAHGQSLDHDGENYDHVSDDQKQVSLRSGWKR